MKDRENKEEKHEGKIEIRPDLQDASKGKDLSYLNEMPQMGGYEGVVAGLPPPKTTNNTGKDNNGKSRKEE